MSFIHQTTLCILGKLCIVIVPTFFTVLIIWWVTATLDTRRMDIKDDDVCILYVAREHDIGWYCIWGNNHGVVLAKCICTATAIYALYCRPGRGSGV